MEYVMNGPGDWELESIGDWRDPLCDGERAMTSRGQLVHLVGEG